MKHYMKLMMVTILMLSSKGLLAETPAGTITEPGFELLNKSENPIWFSLANGKTIDIPVKRLDKGAGYVAKFGRLATIITGKLTEGSEAIDINKPTRLFIWLTDPGKVNYGEKLWSLDDSVPRLNPTPDYVYSFIPGKTIYVSWDKSKFLRPQTGTGGKIFNLKQTDSGFPLKNNVADSPQEIILKYRKK